MLCYNKQDMHEKISGILRAECHHAG